MTDVKQVTEAPAKDARADAVAAFFDMDHTVLCGSSSKLFLRYLWQVGYLPWHHWARIAASVSLYILGLIDFPRLTGRLMTHLDGSREAEAWRISADWFDAVLRHRIADGARSRIAWHQQQGHHAVIISAATPYAVSPVATALGLGDTFLATRLEVRDGRFTGRVTEPACFGSGKLRLAQAYAAQQGVELSRSYFYSDSPDDLPLLAAVGHPVAVNPSRHLARIAARRGWPVVRFC